MQPRVLAGDPLVTTWWACPVTDSIACGTSAPSSLTATICTRKSPAARAAKRVKICPLPGTAAVYSGQPLQHAPHQGPPGAAHALQQTADPSTSVTTPPLTLLKICSSLPLIAAAAIHPISHPMLSLLKPHRRPALSQGPHSPAALLRPITHRPSTQPIANSLNIPAPRTPPMSRPPLAVRRYRAACAASAAAAWLLRCSHCRRYYRRCCCCCSCAPAVYQLTPTSLAGVTSTTVPGLPGTLPFTSSARRSVSTWGQEVRGCLASCVSCEQVPHGWCVAKTLHMQTVNFVKLLPDGTAGLLKCPCAQGSRQALAGLPKLPSPETRGEPKSSVQREMHMSHTTLCCPPSRSRAQQCPPNTLCTSSLPP